MANLELNIEFVIRILLWNRPTSYVLASGWFINNGIATSQRAHAPNYATIPSIIKSYAEHCVNGNDDKLNTVVKWNCKHDIRFLFHTIGRWTFPLSILNWRMHYHAGKHVAVTLTFYIYCCLQHDLLLPLISQEFIGVNETWWHCSCYLAKDNKSENSYKAYLYYSENSDRIR